MYRLKHLSVVIMWFTVESGCSKNLTRSREVTQSSADSAARSSHHVPSKPSTPHTMNGAGAGRVFHNSATAQMASSMATQVSPVYLMNPSTANVVPVPLLSHSVYPVAVRSSPVMHSPWLAASAAATPVSSLSECQSILIYTKNK